MEFNLNKLEKAANGRVHFFLRHLEAIRSLLPPEEGRLLLANPVEFTSSSCFFRGLTRDKVAQFLQEGSMQPQFGQMNSRAVFETDSPYSALTFVTGTLSALAVIDPGKVDVLTPLVQPGTPAYAALAGQGCKICGKPDCQKATCFEVQNYVDTISVSTTGHAWHNIELRKPQPLSVVRCFSVEQQDSCVLLDPADPEHRQELHRLYLC